MAASPQWKVYRNKEYIGCCKHAEDAAALVALGGGIVKHGHSMIVWREREESFLAGESYDGAAKVMMARVRKAHISAIVRTRGAETALRLGATAEEIAAA
jgi:hypothetical protein